MAKYYVDYVGLNTFIYEPGGYDPDNQVVGTTSERERILTVNGVRTRAVELNTIGFGSDGQQGINNYKNANFSHNLPTTASFFPALMLKRNGPYGFPTWKQTRISENPLSRKQRKENIFTFVKEPGEEFTFVSNGKINTLRSKYGSIQKYIEAPVSSRYKPFIVGGGTIVDDGTIERFEIVGSYGNETIFFNNEEINKYNGLRVVRSQQYDTVKGFYLNGGLEADGSPLDSFEYLKYRECVYPPRIYQYKDYTRQRTTFSFPWRDDREDRTKEFSDNGFGSEVNQSMWILDAYSAWETYEDSTSNYMISSFGYDQNKLSLYRETTDQGILQNQYCSIHGQMSTYLSFGSSGIDGILKVAPKYNRNHLLFPSSSVVSPNGMKIEGINTGSTMGDINTRHRPGGDAKWEAGSQSGLNPFYDSYDKYINGVRQYGKDYTIIPEFRISEHVETYQSKGAIEEVADLFSLTGALSNTSDSSAENFYKIYSTSEFMKHFEVVKKDHKEFVDPMSITLKCKAVKKFLPYEGFYPAQRSVDLAKQFYNSYKDFVAVSGAANAYGTSSASPYLFQNLMVPMFAPGIFFNTIKSGVAVDYPLIDSNMFLSNSTDYGNVFEDSDNYYIKNSNNPAQTTGQFFDRRVPFEAIIEPERYLAGNRIYCNEPHPYANNSGSVVWNGGGNNLYKLMAHNFLAETNDFFMKNNRYTTIASKPSSDPTVGLAQENTRYMMRVKMYKSINTSDVPLISGSVGFYKAPQYSNEVKETFTMYSRPSAFGPPQMITASFFSTPYQIKLGETGENYAFTPPYYYGESWADISFVSSEARKYLIEEIIASSSVYYYRFANNTDVENTLRTRSINGPGDDFGDSNSESQIAMNLNASVNLFLQQTDADNSVDPNNPATRWVIQTKFETPMLNFNHLSASDSITLPNNASQSVPRGMWHQYGKIEEDSTKGIFLQVDDIPKDWVENYMTESADYKSLADLCGFSTEATRLGEIKDSKTVFEAVVAVPFIEEEGQRKFFRIPRIDVKRAKNKEEDYLVGASVKTMVDKLQKYVLPPPMDFINNENIDPFAMYVFEFSHTFKKQDLANMWQNLYPEIGQTFETAENSISHELLAHELLGGGAKLTPEGLLDVNAIGNEMPDRVRWMVFKIKQKAKINYYEKIIGRSDSLSEASVNSQGVNVDISYNWPYDYFSLVELAKIESEVKFAERLQKPGQEPRETIVPKVNTKSQLPPERDSIRMLETGKAEAKGMAQEILKQRRFRRAADAAGVGGSRGEVTDRNRTTLSQTAKTVRSHRHRHPDDFSFTHSHPVDLDENGNVISHDWNDRNED